TATRAGQPLGNAVRVAAAGLDAVADADRGRLANELAVVVNRDRGVVPGPSELAAITRFADSTYTEGLLNLLTSFDGDGGSNERRERAEAIVQLAAVMPDRPVLTGALER